MKVTIESTEQIVSFRYDQGTGEYQAQGRVWVGTTESGIPVQMLVVRVAVESAERQEEFERELQEKPAPPPEAPAFPLRMVL